MICFRCKKEWHIASGSRKNNEVDIDKRNNVYSLYNSNSNTRE
jgi:hypothetical protein